MRPPVRLIAGLGNPGRRYSGTRHNAGFWFVERLAQSRGARFSEQARFHGETARIDLDGADCWLLKPRTYVNESGRAVQAMAAFYKVDPESILVAHDEIDLPCGAARLKAGGGFGGHNGLRDIGACLGSNEFVRLRLGVGHPGRREVVVDHVLDRPSADEQSLIDDAIARALEVLPLVLAGDLPRAMNDLHRRPGAHDPEDAEPSPDA